MSLRPPTSTLFPYTTLFRSLFDFSSGNRAPVRVGQHSPEVDQEVGVDALLNPLDFGFGQNPEDRATQDRKSTRLNSSHGYISYAVFCLKKKREKAGKTTVGA